MKPAALDKLLMDRALGSLAPETLELLEAYLRNDPAAAARAAEYDAAAGAARAVLAAATPATLPPFPRERLVQLERTRRQLVVVRNVAGLAAMLVIGVGLGVGYMRSLPAGAPGIGPQAAHRSPGPSEDHPVASGDVGGRGGGALAAAPSAGSAFWSTERLYTAGRRSAPARGTRLIWDSAALRPRLGG